MDNMFFENLCERIGLSDGAVRAAENSFCQNERRIEHLSEKIFKSGDIGILKFLVKLNAKNGGALSLAVMLNICEKTYDEYKKKGIPDEIFFSTMSDIAVWETVFFNQTGFHGVNETNWLINHLQLKIFKIGRLQFQPCKMSLPRNIQGKGLPDKFNCLNVHIPRGEPLDKDLCVQSFKKAVEFFNEFYPDYRYDYFFCHSWLLSREMPQMVNENSNMFGFYSLWNKIGFSENSNQPFEYVWDKKQKNLTDLDEKTSLQRNTKRILLSGKSISEGYGYIERNQFEK